MKIKPARGVLPSIDALLDRYNWQQKDLLIGGHAVPDRVTPYCRIRRGLDENDPNLYLDQLTIDWRHPSSGTLNPLARIGVLGVRGVQGQPFTCLYQQGKLIPGVNEFIDGEVHDMIADYDRDIRFYMWGELPIIGE